MSEPRSRVDHDEIIHSLDSCMLLFTNKPMPETAKKFWMETLRPFTVDQIQRGFTQYQREFTHAPRPAHILEILRGAKSSRQAPPKSISIPCPPDIHAAWAWFIKMHSGMEFGGKNPAPTTEEQERYLLIVNREARRANIPDAIPDEYKLAEIWT